MYHIRLTKQAQKDLQKVSPDYKKKAGDILRYLSEHPFSGKPLVGVLKGNYSYRVNRKDRIVYRLDQEQGILYVKRARTHYGE